MSASGYRGSKINAGKKNPANVRKDYRRVLGEFGFGLLAGTTESGSKMNAKRKHVLSEIGVKCSRLLISSLLSVRSCKIKSNPF